MTPLLTHRNFYLVISIFLHLGQVAFAVFAGLLLELRTDSLKSIGALPYQGGPFSNIPQLIKSVEAERNLSNGTYTQFCARGAWMLYDSPMFTVKNTSSLDGMSMYATTDFKCMPLAEIGPLGSLRPLTFYRYTNPHISLFSSANFMGTQYMVGKKYLPDRGPFADKPSYSPPAGSMITVGKRNWALTLKDGSKLCIKPKQGDNSICLLSNVVDNSTFVSEPEVIYLRTHCRKDVNRTIELTDCYTIGPGLIRPLQTSWPYESPSNGSESKNVGQDCQVDDSNDFLSAEQKHLIEGRLNGTLGGMLWLQRLKDPANIWKTELLDTCLQIFWLVCGNEIVDQEYLILATSLYYHHWDKALELEGGTKYDHVHFSEEEWMELTHNAQECQSEILKGRYIPGTEAIFSLFDSYQTVKDLIDPVDEVLGFKPKYDYVIEINWVIANTVASVCHNLYRGALDFITKFWNIYHPLYFAPVEEQWKNPGNISLAYKYIFGGYGMEKTLAKIMYCGQSSMLTGHWLEPYTRPIDQVDLIFEPRAKSKNGEDGRTADEGSSKTGPQRNVDDGGRSKGGSDGGSKAGANKNGDVSGGSKSSGAGSGASSSSGGKVAAGGSGGSGGAGTGSSNAGNAGSKSGAQRKPGGAAKRVPQNEDTLVDLAAS